MWEWRTTKGHFQIKGPLKAMDDFEAAAEEWDNVIEIVPTFAKGQEITEANFLVLIFSKKPIVFSLISLLRVYNGSNEKK